MTPEERRISFLAGILTNCWNTMNHAVGLASGDHGLPRNKHSRLVNEAFDAVEKAKEAVCGQMYEATVWPEENGEEAANV